MFKSFAIINFMDTFATANTKFASLKHQWSNIHPGSTPGLGTRKRAKYLQIKYLALFFLIKCSHNVPVYPLLLLFLCLNVHLNIFYFIYLPKK